MLLSDVSTVIVRDKKCKKYVVDVDLFVDVTPKIKSITTEQLLNKKIDYLIGETVYGTRYTVTGVQKTYVILVEEIVEIID